MQYSDLGIFRRIGIITPFLIYIEVKGEYKEYKTK